MKKVLFLSFALGVFCAMPGQATQKTVLAGPAEMTQGTKLGTYRVIYKTAEITGYAPLDKRAKEGMCFIGDRTIGANGKKVVPGLTVAAPKSIPFGTEIYVEGHGWRVVGDRGGAIKEGKLDLCVETQEEAFAIGRRTVRIFMLERVETE